MSHNDIDTYLQRLDAHRMTLAHYLKQAAIASEAHVLPEVAYGIHQARGEIRRIKGVLRDWGAVVADHPDDEEVFSEATPHALLRSASAIADIEQAIAGILPSAQRAHISRAARFLVDVLNEIIAEDKAQDQLAANPELLSVIHALLSHRITVGDLQIIFERGRYIGAITALHRSNGQQFTADLDFLPCPYPGMVAFEDSGRRFFYGRQHEVDEAIKLLERFQTLYVIGPSGSGKSSLIAAGIIPEIRQRKRDRWMISEMRPGTEPVHSLGTALEIDLDRLPIEDIGMAVSEIIARQRAAQTFLLVIDQFEELFSQASRAAQAAFIRAIKLLQKHAACKIIITVRADFYADLMDSDLWPIPGSQRLEVVPLRGALLREALVQPAAQLGISLEAGLADQILRDAADEPGVLPLLQETMAQLWNKVEQQQIPSHAYMRLGGEGRTGLAVAFAEAADYTFDLLSPDDQITARRIFLRLIQFGEGRLDTRRQLDETALQSVSSSGEQLEQVLQRLAKQRLLTLNGEATGSLRKVDIAHEALITGWPRLRQWIAERRDAEQMRRRLEAKVQEWRRLGASSAGLLSPTELAEAGQWLAQPDSRDLGIAPELELLVEASRKHIEDAEQERIANQAVRETNRKLALLSDSSNILVSSLDVAQTLPRVAERIVNDFASWCVFDIDLDGKGTQRIAGMHRSAERCSLIQNLPLLPLLHMSNEVGGGQLQRPRSRSRVLSAVNSQEFAPLFLIPAWRAAWEQVESSSAILMPLIVHDQTVGAAILARHQAELPFTDGDVVVAEDLVNRVVLAIENARLYKTMAQTAHAQTTLLDAARILSSLLQPRELLDKLMELVSRQLSVTTAALWTLDADNYLTPAAIDGTAAEPGRKLRVPIGQGHTGHVAATGVPLIIDDLREHGGSLYPRYERDNNLISYMGVPVVYRKRTVGVLSVMTDYRRSFTSDEMLLLLGLADQAAIALENAMLFAETRQNMNEMTTLFEVSQNLSGTLDPDETQFLVADAALRLLRVELSVVLRLDQYGQVEKQVLLDQKGQHDDTMLLFEGLLRQRLQPEQPLALPDLSRIEGVSPHALELGVQSALGIVIGSHDERLGELWVASRHAHEWDEHQISLISILANQAGQALKSAQLFRLERQRRVLADTLRDVAQSFAATLSLREIQTLILDQLARVVCYDGAVVLLRDKDRGHLQISASRGISDPRLLSADFDIDTSELFQTLARERRAMLIEDALIDPRFTTMRQLGWEARSLIGAPLLVDNELVGILAIGSNTPEQYDAEAVEVTFALASQVSHAIQNAQLYSFITELAMKNAILLEEQREETSRSAAIFRSVTEGVIVLDPWGSIVLFNPAAERILDIPAEKLLGSPIDTLAGYGESDAERRRAQTIYSGLMSGLSQMRQSQRIYHMFLELTSPSQVIALNIAPVSGPGGQGYGDVMVLRDVTREREDAGG